MTTTSPTALRFTTSTDPDGATVLHVRGEVDVSTADQLRERLLAEFARRPRLVLDLSRAMFYDGPALRTLHALHEEAVRRHRRPPVLRGVRPLLAKALRATRMDTLFPMEVRTAQGRVASPVPFPQLTRQHPAPAAAAPAAA